eukprot:3737599-Rhodomonas_salina.1
MVTDRLWARTRWTLAVRSADRVDSSCVEVLTVTVSADTVMGRLMARLRCRPCGLEPCGGAGGDGERGHGERSIVGPLALQTMWTRALWSC